MLSAFFSILVFSFLLSLLFTKICIALSHRIGLLDVPGKIIRKNHAESTPLLGGVAVFSSFFVSIFFVLFVSHALHEFLSHWFPNLFPYLPGALQQSKKLFLIFLGGLLILLLGLKDDCTGMNPSTKLSILFLVALLFFYLDIRITLFIETPWVSLFLTLCWILFLTNSFNLLDNMNGLSSGTAVACSLALFLVAITLQQFFIAFYLCAFLGALLGFMVFNFPRAHIFLGDSGALFIGYNLAVITILESFFIAGKSNALAVFMPAFIFVVPLYDTLSVIVIRLKHGTSIFQGDLNHFSHRLVRAGYSKPKAVLIIHALTFLTGVASLCFFFFPWISYKIVLFLFACTMGLLFLTEKVLTKKS
jgi:UDP-GlcNAc:undecaprenyl-phosphate GlcNAc-1-phosphate transferase